MKITNSPSLQIEHGISSKKTFNKFTDRTSLDHSRWAVSCACATRHVARQPYTNTHSGGHLLSTNVALCVGDDADEQVSVAWHFHIVSSANLWCCLYTQCILCWISFAYIALDLLLLLSTLLEQEVRTTDNSRPFRPRSRSLKVIDFCSNRKPIYDFLLVINCHLSSILHRFRDTASRSRKPPTLLFVPRSRGPLEVCHQTSRQRAKALGYILVKTAWSYLRPFCHNTLASQTDRRQTTSYGNIGTCNAIATFR